LTGEHVCAIRYAAQVRNASKIYICRENLGIYAGMDLLRYKCGIDRVRDVYRIVVETAVLCLSASPANANKVCMWTRISQKRQLAR
jgi:hypothetical protein